MDTLNLPLHRDQFPLKKTWNLAKYLLHNKGMTEPQKMVGEAEKWSFQKTIPGIGDPLVGRISHLQRFILSDKRSALYIRHTNPWDLQKRDKSPKYMDLKIYGTYIQESPSPWEGESLLLESSCTDWLPGPSTKHQFVKCWDHTQRRSIS